MLKNRITVSRENLEQFCKRHRIRRLSFFGSVLRDDFRAESDIDVLVEFEAGARIGFLRMAHMENELSEMLERRVDLRTPADLSRYFRQEVIERAEVQYAQG